jgi:rubrerythrin
MEFTSIDDILAFAIGKEEEAVVFYETASRSEESRGIRKLLADQADEERQHVEQLRELREDRSRLTEYRFERIQNIKRSDYLVDVPYRPGLNYVQMMRLAMKREEKSNRLYEALALATDNIEQANFFMRLAQEELKHKQALETTYDDYLARQGD